jgi:hypothetical protein
MAKRPSLTAAVIGMALSLTVPAAAQSPDQETFCDSVAEIAGLYNKIDDERSKRQA